MFIYTSYQIAALLTFASTAILALFVLIKGMGRTAPRLFSFYTFAISLWSFGWFKMISAGAFAEGLLWCRLLHFPATFIPTLFLSFVQHLLGIDKIRKHIISRRIFYAISIVFPFATFSQAFVETVMPKLGFRFYLVPGTFYLTFFIFFITIISITLSLLLVAYKKSNGFKKTQVGLVLVSYLLTYAGGTEVFLPAYGLSLPSVALYLVPMAHLIIAYTILTHRLMDISVIIRKTLTYSAVTGILMAVYLGTITSLTHIFEGATGFQTMFSPTFVAFLIAFCFQPLRKRVQAFVDAKFFRQYVDREQKLYELSREVITHTTPEAMAEALMHVLGESFHPKAATLYLRSKNGAGFAPAAFLGSNVPKLMDEDNPLSRYFVDHSQPFMQDLPSETGASRSTRQEPYSVRGAKEAA